MRPNNFKTYETASLLLPFELRCILSIKMCDFQEWCYNMFSPVTNSAVNPILMFTADPTYLETFASHRTCLDRLVW